jgi:hypothetical protein
MPISLRISASCARGNFFYAVFKCGGHTHSLTVWLALSGTESRFIKPGSPWQNGVVES